MKYYQEITITPYREIPSAEIMNKVFQRLHGILSNLSPEKNVGVSFPEYDPQKDHTLGNKLRLFSEDPDTLLSLNLIKDLQIFEDYIHITQNVKSVPKDHSFAIFSRVHSERSVENKARRHIKRHPGTTFEEAINLFTKKDYPMKRLPDLTLYSRSSQQSHFPIFVKMTKVEKESHGKFSSYGLSSQASVPIFN